MGQPQGGNWLPSVQVALPLLRDQVNMGDSGLTIAHRIARALDDWL